MKTRDLKGLPKWIRMGVATFALAAGLIFANSKTAYAMTETTEAHDSIDNAMAIPFEEEVSATVATGEWAKWDDDCFKITVSQPGYVTIEFTNTNPNANVESWKLDLYSTAGNADGQAYSIYSETIQGDAIGTKETIKIGIGRYDTYYLAVQGNLNDINMSAPYSFKVHFTPANDWELDDNYNEEMAMPITLGQRMNGSICDVWETDYYKLSVPEAGYIWLDYQQDSSKTGGGAFWVSITDENKNTLNQIRIESEVQKKENILKTGVNAGTYYVKVGDGGLFQNVYSFQVNYEPCSNYERENNDTPANANDISYGASIVGNCPNGMDKDHYRFTLNRTGTVILDLNYSGCENCDIDWSIINAEGQTVYATGDTLYGAGEYVSDGVSLPSGTYFVCLKAESTYNTDYNLTIYDDTYQDALVRSFVSRLYRVALDRNPEPAGLADWTNRLMSGEAQAVNIVQGILGSDEYANRGKSNGMIVKDCYRAMLGREAEPDGYNYWVERLNNGMSVNAIFSGFVGSQEFGNLCAIYGIQPGEYGLSEPRDQNYGVTAYVARLYTQALGREYDVAGLNDWCGRILANTSRENIVDVAATGFFHSQEFTEKDLNNEEYVKVLYRTFLGREAEPDGLADWVGQLDRGEKTRDEILPGFANSQEFTDIMFEYGL